MIRLAVDNGPTGIAWQTMADQPGRYAPFIRRLAGYYLMCGAAEVDRDVPDIGSVIEAAMPGFSSLTEDEAYFVRSGAIHILCQDSAASLLDDMAKEWMSEGAPE